MALNKSYMSKAKTLTIHLDVQLNSTTSIFRNGNFLLLKYFYIAIFFPTKIFSFIILSPENVKNRNDVFYLLPEKASLPSSPVWFSSQPVSPKILERMLNRIKMVREVNELLIAASPATSSAMIV